MAIGSQGVNEDEALDPVGFITLNAIPYGSGTTELNQLAPNLTGVALVLSQINGGAPTWAAAGGVTPAALTKVDDTNVTLTLGGTPATALLAATSITVGWTGTLALARFAQGTDGQILVGQTAAASIYRTMGTDATLSATGALTIANAAVTYAKMQNISASSRFLGRITAGAGSTEELTAANAWTILGVEPAANFPALTGDVTTVAGNLATTIANVAVTYAKIQNISATSRVLGRITAGAGSTEELTGANVTTIIGGNLSTLQTPGTWKVLYTDGSSVLTALAVGAANTVFQGAGVAAAPAFSSKTLTISHNITLDSTDQTDTNPGSIYPGLPINSQSANYTTLIGDANKTILHPTGDNNARTFTIDSNANVAFPVGTTVTFINMKNTVTLAITTDTMTLANTALTGNRTLALNGVATAIKITSTTWLISGTGLT